MCLLRSGPILTLPPNRFHDAIVGQYVFQLVSVCGTRARTGTGGTLPDGIGSPEGRILAML
jgi:hypothetical protein